MGDAQKDPVCKPDVPDVGGQCGYGRPDEEAGHPDEQHWTSAVTVSGYTDHRREHGAHDGGAAVGQGAGALAPTVLVLQGQDNTAEGLGDGTAGQV